MKQLGTGAMMYLQDYDETYPGNWFGSATYWYARQPVGGNYHWNDAIFPYVKNAQIFTCPSDAGTQRAYVPQSQLTATTPPNDSSLTAARDGSYAVNNAYWANGAPDPPGTETNMKRITTMAGVANPAGTIYLVEGNGSFQVSWPDVGGQPPTNVAACNNANPPRFGNVCGRGWGAFEGDVFARHQGRSNLVWCDGHASTMDVKRMAELSTSGNNAYRYWTIEDD